jgi:hypothetical protein
MLTLQKTKGALQDFDHLQALLRGVGLELAVEFFADFEV